MFDKNNLIIFKKGLDKYPSICYNIDNESEILAARKELNDMKRFTMVAILKTKVNPKRNSTWVADRVYVNDEEYNDFETRVMKEYAEEGYIISLRKDRAFITVETYEIKGCYSQFWAFDNGDFRSVTYHN